MELFRLLCDIEFEAEDVQDACKKLIEIFRGISKGEDAQEVLEFEGDLEIMSHNPDVNGPVKSIH